MSFIPNAFQVPNRVVDELLKGLSGSELKCYLAIVRKTKGWQKERDRISISQFVELTGLSNKGVINACASLAANNLINIEKGARNSKVYSVNIAKKSAHQLKASAKKSERLDANLDSKNVTDLTNNDVVLDQKASYEKSSPVKKVHSSAMKKVHSSYEKSSQFSYEKSSHTKDTNIKTTIQKKRVVVPEAFKRFFDLYPPNKKGGTYQRAWKKAKSLNLVSEQDFLPLVADVEMRRAADSSWYETYAFGICRYLDEKFWLNPMSSGVKKNKIFDSSKSKNDDFVARHSDTSWADGM